MLMTLYRQIIAENKQDYSRTEQEKDEHLREIINQKLQQQNMELMVKIEMSKKLFNMLRRYGSIQPYIDNKEINEIMILGEDKLYIEVKGNIQEMKHQYYFSGELEQIVQRMVSRLNKQANEKNPICDLYLNGGERVNIVMPPIARKGPIITIRKFPENPFTWQDLLEHHSLNQELMLFLQEAVRKKYNIFVSGGTSSGKTTLLNVLATAIPPNERIITIEDARELQIKQIQNQVNLECRQENFSGEGEINAKDLIKSALRMRPDRIVVGEVRGAEAIDMLQAMNTGHSGSLSTGHSNSAIDMVKRLETMVLSGVEIPVSAIRSQIATAIDIFIHLEKIHGKGRRIVEVSWVCGISEGQIKLKPIYLYSFAQDSWNKVDQNFVLKERWERIGESQKEVI